MPPAPRRKGALWYSLRPTTSPFVTPMARQTNRPFLLMSPWPETDRTGTAVLSFRRAGGPGAHYVMRAWGTDYGGRHYTVKEKRSKPCWPHEAIGRLRSCPTMLDLVCHADDATVVRPGRRCSTSWKGTIGGCPCGGHSGRDHAVHETAGDEETWQTPFRDSRKTTWRGAAGYRAGEESVGNGPSITAVESIPASHKIALRDGSREKVIKYGNREQPPCP